MNSVEKQDCLPLAKYCLQLSYLYRELEQNDNWSEVKDQNDELRYELCNIWKDAPTSSSLALDLSYTYFKRVYEKSSIPARKDIEPQILQMIARLQIMLGKPDEAQQVSQKTIDGAKRVQWDTSCMNIPDYQKILNETQSLLAYATKMVESSESPDP